MLGGSQDEDEELQNVVDENPGLLNVEQAAELKEAFDLVDIDGNGALASRDMGELMDALTEMQSDRIARHSAFAQNVKYAVPLHSASADAERCIFEGVRPPNDLEIFEMCDVADPRGTGSIDFPAFGVAVASFVKKTLREAGSLPPSPVHGRGREGSGKDDEGDNYDDDYDDDGFDDEEESMDEEIEIADDDDEEDFLGN